MCKNVIFTAIFASLLGEKGRPSQAIAKAGGSNLKLHQDNIRPHTSKSKDVETPDLPILQIGPSRFWLFPRLNDVFVHNFMVQLWFFLLFNMNQIKQKSIKVFIKPTTE